MSNEPKAIEKIVNNEERLKLQGFTKIANKKPASDHVLTNSMANNSKYIPIGVIEMKLDELFFGLWSIKNFQTEVIVNEIVGNLELEVFHPVAKVWIIRTGAAAVPIQTKSGSGVYDVENKIKNTLVKDYPHLRAECLKNASKTIGKMFGRDLNRKLEAHYQPLVDLPEATPVSLAQSMHIDNLLHFAEISDEKKKEYEVTLEQAPTWYVAGQIIEELLQVQPKDMEQQLEEVIERDDQKEKKKGRGK